MKLRYLILGFVCLLNCGCNKSEKADIIGKWQSLNTYTVLEFTNESIDLFKDGKPFWSAAAENGKLTYTIKHQYENWYQLKIMDGANSFVKCKIEIVNKDRIRVYYFKHHDILDLADEYHRTKDLNSFDQIIDKIIKEPEVSLMD